MAGKSRWADDEEDAAVTAQLKREKEEKKRLKAERVRKAEEAAAAAKIKLQQQQELEELNAQEDERSSRPSKRRKLSPEKDVEKEELPPARLLRFPAPEWKKCRSVEDFEKLNDIEEGAYGWVSRAKDMKTGQVVALKRLKMDNANDGIPVTGLREIQTLRDCDHPNIVGLKEVVVGEDMSKIERYSISLLAHL